MFDQKNPKSKETIFVFSISERKVKQKDALEFTPMQFMKVSIKNSVVLEETDLEQRPAEAKLGKNDRIALDAFEEAFEAKQATSEDKSECCLHLDE